MRPLLKQSIMLATTHKYNLPKSRSTLTDIHKIYIREYNSKTNISHSLLGYLSPEALALGTAMVTSMKRRRDIIDDSYNRCVNILRGSHNFSV